MGLDEFEDVVSKSQAGCIQEIDDIPKAYLAVAHKYRRYALLGVQRVWKAYATYSFGAHMIDKVIEEDAGGEILLWVVCGESKNLEVCQNHGWLPIPAHQQAYLRNVSGKRPTRYADVTEATMSSPKKPVPCRTCREETTGRDEKRRLKPK